MSGPVDVLAVLDAVLAFAARGVESDDPAREMIESGYEARAAVAELIEADGQAIDTLDSLIHAMALPVPDALHMKALRAALPDLLEAKRAALARAQGGAA